MLRTLVISAAFLGLSASAASADSFFFGWGTRPAPVYVQPAPVVHYWQPGPVYYSSAPVYYGQPRAWGHRRHYTRPVHYHYHGHGGHGHGHGHKGHRR